MIDAPELQKPTKLKQNILRVREAKDVARVFETRIVGRTSNEFREICYSADLVLGGLENEYEHFITQKFTELESYLDTSYDNLREHHNEGFRKFLLQQYRTYKKEQPSSVDSLKEEESIKDLAIGYTFDYIRTLTLGKRMGISSKNALMLAEVSHWNTPNVLISLAKKFPDADPNVIFNAAAHRPAHPEDFLREVLEAIPRLQEKFPDMDLGIIKGAATNYRSAPEQYLQGVNDAIPRLQEKFPDIDLGTIKKAASDYSSDPEEFIQGVITTVSKLREKFPEADVRLLKTAANMHPLDPEGFVNKVTERVQSLQASFPEIDLRIIKTAAINYGSNPEVFIRKVLSDIPDLQLKFPDIPLSVIKAVVISHTSDSEGFIRNVSEKAPGLQKEFPDLSASVVYRALIGYRDPQTFLREVQNRIQASLKQRNQA